MAAARRRTGLLVAGGASSILAYSAHVEHCKWQAHESCKNAVFSPNGGNYVERPELPREEMMTSSVVARTTRSRAMSTMPRRNEETRRLRRSSRPEPFGGETAASNSSSCQNLPSPLLCGGPEDPKRPRASGSAVAMPNDGASWRAFLTRGPRRDFLLAGRRTEGKCARHKSNARSPKVRPTVRCVCTSLCKAGSYQLCLLASSEVRRAVRKQRAKLET